MGNTSASADAPADRMQALAQAAKDACSRGPAPVHLWNPKHCGRLDLTIRADGSWLYQGSPIGRPALVKLFSTVLRRDPHGYVLVTPAERLDIEVEDAPFVAVEMATDGAGRDRRIRFRTNVDEVVDAGPEHPLRFETGPEGGCKPYVLVRADLWALVTRSAAYDLLDLTEESAGALGVWAGGTFFPVGDAGT